MTPKKQKRPDAAVAKFMIVASLIIFTLTLFPSRISVGERISTGGIMLMGLSWGLKELVAAKKWKQKYGEPTPTEQIEMKERHSVSNLPILLTWLILSIAALALLGVAFVTLFHH